MSKITFSWDIDGFADQTMRVVLDSQTYEMRFQWNERDESWLVSFGDVGSTPTISFKLTTIFDIFAPFKYLENIPSGQLRLFIHTVNQACWKIHIGFCLTCNSFIHLQTKNLTTRSNRCHLTELNIKLPSASLFISGRNQPTSLIIPTRREMLTLSAMKWGCNIEFEVKKDNSKTPIRGMLPFITF